jgi:hypothetical protein
MEPHIEKHMEKIVAFFHRCWPIPEGDVTPIPEDHGEDSWETMLLD